jgi:phage recombination protein Bet
MNKLIKEERIVDVWQKSEVIRKLFAPTLSQEEFLFFMGLGKSMGANPFKREIWAIKYDSKAPASIFLARDFYRKVAQSQPDYKVHRSFSVYENDQFKIKNGNPDHEFTLKNRGKLIGAYAELIKKGIDQSFVVYVDFSEYNTGRSNWKKMPATMISKVAEAQVLRMAYQNLFSGTYSEDEAEIIENNYKRIESDTFYQEPPMKKAEVPEQKKHQKPLFEEDDNPQNGSYAEKIENYLYAEFGEDEDTKGNFLENLTAFKGKDGKEVKGKRSVAELSLARQKVTWHKIEKL